MEEGAGLWPYDMPLFSSALAAAFSRIIFSCSFLGVVVHGGRGFQQGDDDWSGGSITAGFRSVRACWVRLQRQFGQADLSFFSVSGLINTDNCSLFEEPSPRFLDD